MKFKFQNKAITGILTVLPQNEVYFDDEVNNYNFPPTKSMKLKLAMGFNKHCIAEEGVCGSDLCEEGMRYLFNQGLLKREEIDALVLVTQSGDYIMPPTSNVLQGKLGLKEDTFCIDINQGCAGYIIGLFEAFMLLEQESINKVVLLNADVLSPKVSQKDRNSYPLVGDGAAVTVIEKSTTGKVIRGEIKMDGSRAETLMIPAGGARLPHCEKTALMVDDGTGNLRSAENLVMQGDGVFNFMQNEVPQLIENLLADCNCAKEEIDYFMFHQPNRFMLQKLSERLNISTEKLPNNIVENFGNASGVTVPTNISYNIGDKLLSEQFKICMAGFGVGLTWGAILLDMGPLEFNKIIRC